VARPNIWSVCPDGAIYAGMVGGKRIYAAPKDEGMKQWSKEIDWDIGDTIVTETSLTDGWGNTNILMDMEGDYEAARACRAKGAKWYLPSRDELNVMYTNRAVIGGGRTGEQYYWSSSGDDNGAYGDAWVQLFSNGLQYKVSKFFANYVWCVRF